MFNGLVELYQRMGIVGSIVTSLIVALFIFGFYVNILIRRRYLSLSEELAAFCAGQINEFRSDMLTWISDEYKASLKSGAEAINSSTIIEMAIEAYLKLCVLGESYLKKVNGLLITTGLFGTFLGLTSAIGSIGGLLSNTNTEALISKSGVNTFTILLSSFQGMSVAFITSLFGTGFSILFSILMTFLSAAHAKKLFMTQLEEYLDVKLVSESMETKIKQNLDRQDEINILTRTLSDSLTYFNETVGNLDQELHSLKEFNKQFSQNLAEAGKSVSKLCQSIDKQTETVSQSGSMMSVCSLELQTLVKEIKGENRKLESMSGIFSDLSKKLDDSTQDRKLFLKAVNEIPDRLLNYSEAAVARIERKVIG